jgi:hypothetical protein
MIWVTRKYVHVDRVACPWLIKRFIDKQAQFIFLPREEIPQFVQKTGAIPFDTGTGIELDHHECHGEKHCSFDAIFEKYHLDSDLALERLREIVRAADTDRLNEEPLALGLEIVASGAPLLGDNDHDTLVIEFPYYDILYTYFQREIILANNKLELEKLKDRGSKQEFIRQKLKELRKK